MARWPEELQVLLESETVLAAQRLATRVLARQQARQMALAAQQPEAARVLLIVAALLVVVAALRRVLPELCSDLQAAPASRSARHFATFLPACRAKTRHHHQTTLLDLNLYPQP